METEKALAKIKKSSDYRFDVENRQYISDVERDLEKLKTDAAFQKLDQVKEIRLKLKSIIASASRKLIDEDNPDMRLRIKADRDAYTWLLRFFSKNVETELQEINQKLNEYLER